MFAGSIRSAQSPPTRAAVVGDAQVDVQQAADGDAPRVPRERAQLGAADGDAERPCRADEGGGVRAAAAAAASGASSSSVSTTSPTSRVSPGARTCGAAVDEDDAAHDDHLVAVDVRRDGDARRSRHTRSAARRGGRTGAGVIQRAHLVGDDGARGQLAIARAEVVVVVLRAAEADVMAGSLPRRARARRPRRLRRRRRHPRLVHRHLPRFRHLPVGLRRSHSRITSYGDWPPPPWATASGRRPFLGAGAPASSVCQVRRRQRRRCRAAAPPHAPRPGDGRLARRSRGCRARGRLPRRQVSNSHDATGGVTLRARRPPLASATTSEYALTGAPSAGGMLHVSEAVRPQARVVDLELRRRRPSLRGTAARGAGGGEGAVSALGGRTPSHSARPTGRPPRRRRRGEAVTICCSTGRRPAAPIGWIHSVVGAAGEADHSRFGARRRAQGRASSSWSPRRPTRAALLSESCTRRRRRATAAATPACSAPPRFLQTAELDRARRDRSWRRTRPASAKGPAERRAATRPPSPRRRARRAARGPSATLGASRGTRCGSSADDFGSSSALILLDRGRRTPALKPAADHENAARHHRRGVARSPPRPDGLDARAAGLAARWPRRAYLITKPPTAWASPRGWTPASATLRASCTVARESNARAAPARSKSCGEHLPGRAAKADRRVPRSSAWPSMSSGQVLMEGRRRDHMRHAQSGLGLGAIALRRRRRRRYRSKNRPER